MPPLEGDTAANVTKPLFDTDTLPTFDRFLKWKDFAPRYFSAIVTLANTVFAPENLNPVIDRLVGGWLPASRVQSMKDIAAQRRDYILTNLIPLALNVTTGPAVDTTSGYRKTTTATANTTNAARRTAIIALAAELDTDLPVSATDADASSVAFRNDRMIRAYSRF